MKVISILLLLSFSSSLFSQDRFIRDLNQIISDTANHFQKFKGSARKITEPELTYYNSLIRMEGTKENLIILHRSICTYSAVIADSVTKTKGEKIFNEWKLKLMSALGIRHTNEKSELKKETLVGQECHYDKGNLSISIKLLPYFNEESLYNVRLFISNEHPR